MAAATVAISQYSFRKPLEISLDDINFYTGPSKNPTASRPDRTLAAPEKRPIGNSEKKVAPQKRPLKLTINDEDEHVDELHNHHQVKEGNSKGNPIIIEDDEADSDLETEGEEAGACTKPLNLGDRNDGSDGRLPSPGVIQGEPPLQAHTKLAASDSNHTDNPPRSINAAIASQSGQELGTYMPADQELSGTEKAESFDVPPVNGESDRERANTGGELLSTPNKRKLDQLNQLEDVDYNSDTSARDGSEDSQNLRPRKQRKPLAPFKSSFLDSQLLHEGTNRNSGDDNHDIDDNRIEDGRTVSTTPRASPSHQVPTSFSDMGPSHDRVGDGGHYNSLNDLVDDSTEEEEEGGDDDDDDDNDESNNGDGNEDEDEKEASSSSSEDDNNDSDDEDYKGHRYAERQRLSTSIRGNTALKRAAQLHAQHRHSTSSIHESDRSTAHTSNLHKPLAYPKRSPHRARKPTLTDYLPESDEAASKVASYASKGEWPIQGFLRCKRNGRYAIEFSLNHRHYQPPSPVDPVKQAQRQRPKSRFTAEEDALLIELKEGQNLPWEQIRKRFPGRTVGSLQVHYSTKLKDRTAVRRRR
ncbi:hypothetical protein K469DRAFT_756475 [Zopfia rhizophila CBS 207.26]|uniref:Myb-like domain-containing protein n=1 Tax=Zopfia rhizophila CBS 207.26 TaxID=1314779 RepID=A0A6A6D7H1_9PEZI|nr:hypothetical protein K469DRAFT_756475 [Zopfia rhizophila CBS 207.26]